MIGEKIGRKICDEIHPLPQKLFHQQSFIAAYRLNCVTQKNISFESPLMNPRERWVKMKKNQYFLIFCVCSKFSTKRRKIAEKMENVWFPRKITIRYCVRRMSEWNGTKMWCEVDLEQSSTQRMSIDWMENRRLVVLREATTGVWEWERAIGDAVAKAKSLLTTAVCPCERLCVSTRPNFIQLTTTTSATMPWKMNAWLPNHNPSVVSQNKTLRKME